MRKKDSKPKGRAVRKQKKKGKPGSIASMDDTAEEVLQGQQQVLGDLSQVSLPSPSKKHDLIVPSQVCNVLLAQSCL